MGCGFFPNPAPFPSLVSYALDLADQCLSEALKETITIEQYNSEMVSILACCCNWLYRLNINLTYQ